MGLKVHFFLVIMVHKAKSKIFTISRLSFGGITKYTLMLDQVKSYFGFNKKKKKSENVICTVSSLKYICEYGRELKHLDFKLMNCPSVELYAHF